MKRWQKNTILMIGFIAIAIVGYMLFPWSKENEHLVDTSKNADAGTEKPESINSGTLESEGLKNTVKADRQKAKTSEEKANTSIEHEAIKNPYSSPTTREERQLKENHQALLEIEQESLEWFNQAKRARAEDGDYEKPPLKKWAISLYLDALLMRLLYEDGLSDSVREKLEFTLKNPSWPVDTNLISERVPESGPHYTEMLNTYLRDVDNNNTELTFSMVLDLVNRTRDLASRRKRSSDNHYISKIRKVLLNDDYSFQSKYRYMEGFVEDKATELARYGAEYFADLHEHRVLTEEEKMKVESLLRKTGYGKRK